MCEKSKRRDIAKEGWDAKKDSELRLVLNLGQYVGTWHTISLGAVL
jgi:hypothetical protein